MKIVIHNEDGKDNCIFNAKLIHFRNRDIKGRIINVGGGTVLSITIPSDNKLSVFSVKCSMKDKFIKARGLELCLRKLVGKLFKKQILVIDPPTNNRKDYNIYVSGGKVEL
mgnify:CR=1 FL=1